MKGTIFVSTSSFAANDPAPLEMLRSSGYAVELNPHGRALTEEEITGFLKGKVALVAGTEPLTRAVFEANPGLRAIARVGAGMDNVDLEAAAHFDIEVTNTPKGPAVAVAELALGLMIDVLRGISRSDRDVRAGVWKKRTGNLLTGKTVGIVGFGNVGHALADLLAPFECHVCVYDPFVHCARQPEHVPWYLDQVEDFDHLLEESDIVSLHVPMCGATRSLLDADAIARMKDGAVLLNTARGGLVDEEAVAEAVRAGRLAGAAFDVFGLEPYEGPLTGLDEVVLTPHIGSYAAEARVRMEEDAAANVLKSLGED